MSLIDYLAEKKIKQMVGHKRGGHNAWIPMFFEKKSRSVFKFKFSNSLYFTILHLFPYFDMCTASCGSKVVIFFVLNIKENR